MPNKSPFKSETQQLAYGIEALVVCIAQLQAKHDQSYPKRLESLLADWHEAITQKGGAPYGTELLRSVRASLLDPKLFPKSAPK